MVFFFGAWQCASVFGAEKEGSVRYTFAEKHLSRPFFTFPSSCQALQRCKISLLGREKQTYGMASRNLLQIIVNNCSCCLQPSLFHTEKHLKASSRRERRDTWEANSWTQASRCQACTDNIQTQSRTPTATTMDQWACQLSRVSSLKIIIIHAFLIQSSIIKGRHHV